MLRGFSKGMKPKEAARDETKDDKGGKDEVADEVVDIIDALNTSIEEEEVRIRDETRVGRDAGSAATKSCEYCTLSARR